MRTRSTGATGLSPHTSLPNTTPIPASNSNSNSNPNPNPNPNPNCATGPSSDKRTPVDRALQMLDELEVDLYNPN